MGCTRAGSVCWIGWPLPPRRTCELLEARGFRWRVVASATDVSRIADRSVLCFAPGSSAALVTRTLDALPNITCAAIVQGVGENVAEFAELLDDDRIFYLARRAMNDADLATLIASAFRETEQDERELAPDVLRRVATAQSVYELAAALRVAIARTVDAERCRCLLFDRDRQVLWSPSRGRDDGESIAAGLSSFVLHTATSIRGEHVADDARYDADLDNPDGRDDDRLLAVPVRMRNGEVIAVLVALREQHQNAFDLRDVELLEALAMHVAPYVRAWMPVDEAENDSPFRPEALRELASPSSVGAEPLRLDPRWMRSVPLLIVLALLLASLVAILVVTGGVRG